MKFEFRSEVEIFIDAPRTKVWAALTRPEIVKRYFFNIDLETDWEVGSSIIYKGEWEGIPFIEKGFVIEIVPEVLIVLNFRTVTSTLPDELENYQIITYKLDDRSGSTRLTVTQENIESNANAIDSTNNWGVVLEELKKLLEYNTVNEK